MAGSEETVVLRLQAANEADAALNQVKQRVDGLKQSYEQAAEKAKTLAAANNKQWVDASRESNKYFDQLQKSYGALDRATARSRQAHEAYDQSLAKIRAQTSALSSGIEELVGRYASVGAVIETVRRGFIGFAEDTRGFNRIQADTAATKNQIHELSESIENLSSVTGESIGELQKGFRTFQQESALGIDQARKTYEQVSLAAHAAGVSTQALAKATTAAMSQMNVPITEVQGVLDTWVKTVPSSMLGAWAEASPRILGTLKSIGFTGKEVAGQVGTSFAEMGKQLGSAGAGGAALDQIWSKARDFNTFLGKMSIPALERLRDDPDAYNKGLKAIHAELASMGAFDTSSLAQQSWIASKIGLTPEVLQAFNAHIAKLKEMEAIAAKLGVTVDVVAKRMLVLSQDPQAAIDRLTASFTSATTAVGKMVDAAGGTWALDKMAKALDIWTKLQSVTSLFGVGVPAITPAQIGAAGVKAGAQWLKGGGSHGEEAPPPISADKQKAIDEELEKRKLLKPPSARRAFALGGEFRVPGSGSSDTEPVEFMGTPGERVTIAPKAADTAESLQQQQDKADIAMREHFARFHRSDRERKGADIGKMLKPDDRSGGAGSGFDKNGRWIGDPAAGTRTGTGGSGGQASGTGAQDGTPGTPGVGDTPLNTPVGLDPASATGPAESLEEAYKRGYLVPPGGSGATYGPQDRNNKSIPASIRYNNPGAQWPGQDSARFGMTDQGVIGGGNKIAGFPTPVHGLASNIALAHRNYVGMTVGAAIHKWSGGGRGSVPGFDSNAIFTKEMANDPKFWMAMHGAESGQKGGLSQAQIGQALGMYQAGSAAAYEKANPDFVAANKGQGAPGGPGTTTVAGLKQALEGGGAAPVGTGGGALPDQANRPNYYGGTITIGNETFRYGSGGTKRGSAPYGSFPVNIDKGDIGPIGQQIGSIATVGGPSGTINDPKYPGAPRAGVQIHPVAGHNLDKLYTAGCFGIPKKDWPRFKAALLRENAAQGGKLVLTVDKSGRASIGGVQVAPTVEEATKTAGPAALSGIEQRAAERYKTAHERQASPAAVDKDVKDVVGDGDVGDLGIHKPTVIGDTGAHPLAPKLRPISRPGREDKAAGKGRPTPIVRPVSAPGKEDTAAGKGRPAPVVRPVAAEGHEERAAGKGVAPAEGLAEGGNAAAGHEYWVGENGPEILQMGGQSGAVRNRWQHMQESSNVQDIRGSAFHHTEEANEAVKFTERNRTQMEGGLTDTLGGGQLDAAFLRNLLKNRAARGAGGQAWEGGQQQVIEPVIKPRMQMLGPSSLRWSRHTARQQQNDASRQAARSSHTDSGFA